MSTGSERKERDARKADIGRALPTKSGVSRPDTIVPFELNSLAESTQRALAKLRETLHQSPNLVLPVIGSGLSTGLPSWVEFLRELSHDADVDIDLPEDARTDELLEFAERIETKEGPQFISSHIERVFARPMASRPESYEWIANLPAKQFATTNWDPWLHDAIVQSGRAHAPEKLTPSIDDAAWSRTRMDDPPFVLYLHGCAADSRSCVLTPRSYADVQNRPAFKQGFGSLVNQRCLLFIGHSVSDPDLQWFLRDNRELFEQHAGSPKHWWLGLDLGGESVRTFRELGIEPVRYGFSPEDHSRLPAILRYLTEQPEQMPDDGFAAKLKLTTNDSPPSQPHPTKQSVYLIEVDTSGIDASPRQDQPWLDNDSSAQAAWRYRAENWGRADRASDRAAVTLYATDRPAPRDDSPALSEGATVACDITALITLYELQLLDRAGTYVELIVPDQYLSWLELDRADDLFNAVSRSTSRIASAGNKQLSKAQVAAAIAKQHALPLLADDRALHRQLEESVESRSEAWCTADLINSMSEAGRLSHIDYVDAVTRLIEWGYRVMIPTKDVLKSVFDAHWTDGPNTTLRAFARYAHDCMADPGLVTRCALEMCRHWSFETLSCLIEIWKDAERYDDQRATAITTWVFRELLPAPPAFADTSSEARFSDATRRANASLTIGSLSMACEDADRAALAVDIVSRELGLSQRRVADIVVECATFDGDETPEFKAFATNRLLTTTFGDGRSIDRRTLARLTTLDSLSHERQNLDQPPAELVLAAVDQGDEPLVFEYPPERDLRVADPVVALLSNSDATVRSRSLERLRRARKQGMIAPQTWTAIEGKADALLAGKPSTWLNAACDIEDELERDWHYCLAHLAIEQALGLTESRFGRQALRPSHGMVQSLMEQLRSELSQDDAAESLADIVSSSNTLADALQRFDPELGYVPAAHNCNAAHLVAIWESQRGRVDELWDTVWTWARSSESCRPSYHACELFVALPERIPSEALRSRDFINEVLSLLSVVTKPNDAAALPWKLRGLLATHYFEHTRAMAGDQDAELIAHLSWRMAEEFATVCTDQEHACEQIERGALVESRRVRSVVLRQQPPYGSLAHATAIDAKSLWARALLGSIELAPATHELFDEESRLRIAETLLTAALVTVPSDSKRPWDQLARRVLKKFCELDGNQSAATLDRFDDIFGRDQIWSDLADWPSISSAEGQSNANAILSVLLFRASALAFADTDQIQRLWQSIPSPETIAKELNLAEPSEFERFLQTLIDCPAAPVDHKLSTAEFAAKFAAALTQNEKRVTAYVYVIAAAARDRTNGVVQRLVDRAPPGFMDAARRVRTAFLELARNSESWITARLRPILALLPNRVEDPEQAARRRRASQRKHWKAEETRLHEAREDAALDSKSLSLGLMWDLMVQAFLVSGRALPDYRREESPGAVWRSGNPPPEHAA